MDRSTSSTGSIRCPKCLHEPNSVLHCLYYLFLHLSCMLKDVSKGNHKMYASSGIEYIFLSSSFCTQKIILFHIIAQSYIEMFVAKWNTVGYILSVCLHVNWKVHFWNDGFFLHLPISMSCCHYHWCHTKAIPLDRYVISSVRIK